jgi:hypothetical protein
LTARVVPRRRESMNTEFAIDISVVMGPRLRADD